jgi:hypothetical protein
MDAIFPPLFFGLIDEWRSHAPDLGYFPTRWGIFRSAPPKAILEQRLMSVF